MDDHQGRVGSGKADGNGRRVRVVSRVGPSPSVHHLVEHQWEVGMGVPQIQE